MKSRPRVGLEGALSQGLQVVVSRIPPEELEGVSGLQLFASVPPYSSRGQGSLKGMVKDFSLGHQLGWLFVLLGFCYQMQIVRSEKQHHRVLKLEGPDISLNSIKEQELDVTFTSLCC